jgi:hypothetical protein
MPRLHGLQPEQLARLDASYLEEAVLDVLYEAVHGNITSTFNDPQKDIRYDEMAASVHVFSVDSDLARLEHAINLTIRCTINLNSRMISKDKTR